MWITGHMTLLVRSRRSGLGGALRASALSGLGGALRAPLGPVVAPLASSLPTPSRPHPPLDGASPVCTVYIPKRWATHRDDTFRHTPIGVNGVPTAECIGLNGVPRAASTSRGVA